VEAVTSPARPNVVPIHAAVDRAMLDELGRWTIPLPDELRLALARAVVLRLQRAGMLNFDRPWEADDEFADVLAEARVDPSWIPGGPMSEIEVYAGDWTPEQAVEIRSPRAGWSITVSREQWATFVRRVKAGEFDSPGKPAMEAIISEHGIPTL
jgi:hypothetical protein